MTITLNKKIAYLGCLGVIGIISTEFGIIGIYRRLLNTMISILGRQVIC